MITRARASALLAGGAALGTMGLPAFAVPKPVPGLNKIEHIIVIYLENRSFDHLYGMFPGADGLAHAGGAAPQADAAGKPYASLPAFKNRPLDVLRPSLELPALPNKPFDLASFVAIDLPLNAAFEQANNYYQAQQAINGGKMDGYVAVSGSPVMGYYDGSSLPMWQYAKEFVLADRFFQAAFGGTGMNHAFLFSGGLARWPNAPAEYVAQLAPDGTLIKDGLVTPDGFIVNNLTQDIAAGVPLQTTPHIGNRLDAAGISWAWYAGGNTPSSRPHLLWKDLAAGTEGWHKNVRDNEDVFVADLKAGTLPRVAIVKPAENEHPKEMKGLLDADRHAAALVRAVQDSAYWKSSVIIVTYDEGHSFWDHVAPPRVDRWGPGRRIPALVISPLAKKRFVDHTPYDTTSILKLIETRFGLEPLGPRDAAAADLTNALQLG
ncbi:MAG TPA: alkaline phosphatase family protein [Candidatus Lustribacter sp.]|jgi:phospholipase C|nr:alkaline phosphatase family protein [Candidatus Lustribacter sp.]